MPLGSLDRSQMRASQSYADYMTAQIAAIENQMDEFRTEFGEEPPQDLRDRLSTLKADITAEKALAARLSQEDGA